MARCLAGCVLAAVVGLLGCGGGPKTFPVKGKVVFEQGDVKLLAGSALYAQHETEPVQASGDLREDGSFELRSRTPDGKRVPGAPEGKYRAWIRFDTDAGTEESQFRKTRIDPKFLRGNTTALGFEVPTPGELVLTVTPAKGKARLTGCGDDDPDESLP